MASAIPSTNISDMLGSLLDIISKYEANDPENPPKEGDYLLAMNTLKALNDRKGAFNAGQNQMVVVMRERIRRIPNLLEITQRHANWMLKKMEGYLNCEICGAQLKNEYALNRHKKRAVCQTEMARRFFFSPVFHSRIKRWAARGWQLDFPFVAALMGIIQEAQPVIVILPGAREHICPSHMVPRRLLPRHFWESIWSATAQNVNPRYAFRYEPNMFCSSIKRDGPTGFLRLYRGSILSQARRIYIPFAENQYQVSISQAGRLANTQTASVLENWSTHSGDRRPLVTMLIAPRKRPRFKSVPEVMNFVAGADPITQFPAELANFSTILPPEQAQAPEVQSPASSEGSADNYNV